MSDTAIKLNFEGAACPTIPVLIDGEEFSIEFGKVGVDKAIDEMQERMDETGGTYTEDILPYFDEFVDLILGSGSAVKIFAKWSRNIYVRLQVIDRVLDAYRITPQAKALSRIEEKFDAQNVKKD